MIAVAPSASSWETRLAALASDGSHRRNPVALFYLQTLARRLATQSGGVRQLLETKLVAALADYDQRVAEAEPRQAAAPTHHAAPSALAALNQYICHQTRSAAAPGAANEVASAGDSAAPDMKSVASFKQAWVKIRTQDQVRQAIAQGPENAGPLNSHMLLLRSLTLMRQLSPDYLQHFMAQVDGLLWLDQVNLKATAAAPAPARRASRQTTPKAATARGHASSGPSQEKPT